MPYPLRGRPIATGSDNDGLTSDEKPRETRKRKHSADLQIPSSSCKEEPDQRYDLRDPVQEPSLKISTSKVRRLLSPSDVKRLVDATVLAREKSASLTPAQLHRRSSKSTGSAGILKSLPKSRLSRNSPLPPSGELKTPNTIETRRLVKSKVKDERGARCTICKCSAGPLKPCSGCGLLYHLNKCLQYSIDMGRKAESKKDWRCPMCIRCGTCSEIVCDTQNRECTICLRAFHGCCARGEGTAFNWTCRKCLNSPKRRSRNSDNGQNANTSPTNPVSPTNHQAKPKGRRGRPKGSTGKKRLQESGQDFAQWLSRVPPYDESVDEILISHNEVMSELRNLEKNMYSPSQSPKKRLSGAEPLAKINLEITTQEDRDLYQSAKREYEKIKREREPVSFSPSKPETAGKMVYVGMEHKQKALYDSPYPKSVLSGEAVYVCQYCLAAYGDGDMYRIHMNNCYQRYPPGNEIYREVQKDGGALLFFEIDGAKVESELYCRNLCLFARMFISWKILHYEVGTFYFYVLVEKAPEGLQIVGYFSKEKNPSKNNNLSCLLTVPGYRRKGYGQFLIDMSYELSRVERKVGSPEHPLSDLGLMVYQAYWRSSILSYIRSTTSSSVWSIKSISLATRIHPMDIVQQLLRDELLVYKDGTYFIKQRHAMKLPLGLLRRRQIDSSKLIWVPSCDYENLDPTKLNDYVST